MSLQPIVDYTVPEQTARVAKAAFPKSTLCLQIYDRLGTIFQDQDFAEVFPTNGQPAKAPFRLALITILQYVEGLSDRQAANAVRSRLDWKYLLCLELEDPGFDFSILCEFRGRLLSGSIENRLFDKLLDLLKEHELVKGRVRTRTDSTHVVAAVREMNRLERVTETIRATLNALSTVMPEWVQQTVPVDWVERYGPRAEDYRLPQQESKRVAYVEQVGCDGNQLLDALWSVQTPAWLRQIPAVEILRQVWIHNFIPLDGQGARWRERKDLPPGARHISSPYDAEARWSKKRNTSWVGYKVHVTESCDDDLPHLLTNIQTTSSVLSDSDALAAIHKKLHHSELLPSIHLVDSGYVGAKQLIDSRDEYDIDLFGPAPGNHRWQFQQGAGFDLSNFTVDWEKQYVSCPNGKISSVLRPMVDHRGHDVMSAKFRRNDCAPCKDLAQCTTAASRQRTVTIKAKPLYEALNSARERQNTDEFKELYKKRSGIEGTISQGVRAFGLRRARYRSYAKTGLQHIATAAAMNLVRLEAWFNGRSFTDRQSAFVRVMAPILA